MGQSAARLGPAADRRGRLRWAVCPVPRAGFAFAVLCALTALLAGFGHRRGWWSFGTGLEILQWSVYGALAAGALSLVGVVLAPLGRAWGTLSWALLGLVLATATVWIPWSHIDHARVLPMIHDITTDPADPPQFVAVLPLRSDAPDSAVYGGPAVAALQARAYPGVRPARYRAGIPQVFRRALAVARAMDWRIVTAEPAQGRIEATATSFWFGFKDDIVVRIRATPYGTRVDLRSESRVGHGDLGANARRIEAFLARLHRRMAGGAPPAAT
ncbi:hypothetical protein BMS3Abin12_01536 [bacterium BMS3Abin12]|nr:hypothetical protein BMS3Abin12_01536 [bacterium BMS3Abin12]